MIPIILVVSAYISAQIFSDVMSLRIVMIFGLSVDAGTLIYPITFTLRDLAHKVLGIKATRVLIVAAAVINLVMALLFYVASILPADMGVGPQTEFSVVLSPVWRIVFASIVAEVVSELVDTHVYQLWVNRVGSKWQWGRVLTSNSVSVPVDSALFCSLAFIGVMPISVVLSIFIANVLIKGLTTIVSIPLIYAVPETE